MNKKHGMALAVALGLMLSGFAHAEEEEGKLELTEQQIQAAGIQLAQAQPRAISTVLT
ncbi:efflux RND transporter periplasmic adaptor subunit, partial [Pseudomonas sp. HMWF011]